MGGRGDMRGVGTVITPYKNPDWFSNGEDESGGSVAGAKKPIPMPPEIELEIASLRRSIPALEAKLRSVETDLTSEKAKLRRLLGAYGQPIDDGLDQQS